MKERHEGVSSRGLLKHRRYHTGDLSARKVESEGALSVGPSVTDLLQAEAEHQSQLPELHPVRHELMKRDFRVLGAGVVLRSEDVDRGLDEVGKDPLQTVAIVGAEFLDRRDVFDHLLECNTQKSSCNKTTHQIST